MPSRTRAKRRGRLFCLYTKRVRAFIAIDPASGMYGPRIGAALAKPLDNFMVPKGAIVLDSLPKSENGKITRKALRTLEVSP